MVFYDPNRPRRGGLGTRIIMALVIVAIGWIMYLSHTEQNPITGEHQRVAISPAQEIKLGLESAPHMTQEMGGELPLSDARTQEVQRLGQKLVQDSGAHKSPWQFKFHLLKDQRMVNAFALPGGQIFITLALYSKLANEAELAGVLGHEMGHVIERHAAQQMAKNQLGQWVMIAVATGASDPDQPNSSRTPMMVASLVNQMIQLRYGRADESQADIWGIKIVEKAGFNPRAMVRVMEVLKKEGGQGAPLAIFQSHPDPDLRIKQIEAYLKEHPPAANLTMGQPLRQ